MCDQEVQLSEGDRHEKVDDCCFCLSKYICTLRKIEGSSHLLYKNRPIPAEKVRRVTILESTMHTSAMTHHPDSYLSIPIPVRVIKIGNMAYTIPLLIIWIFFLIGFFWPK